MAYIITFVAGAVAGAVTIYKISKHF